MQSRCSHTAVPPGPRPRSLPPVTCLEGLEGGLPVDAGPGRGPAGALWAAGSAHHEPIHARPAALPHGSRHRGPAISAR